MTQEIGDFEPDITGSEILRVSVPHPFNEPFRLAGRFALGSYYLVGSSVRNCILGESNFPNDVDFLGSFDLDKIEAHFGNRVLGKSNPPGIMKVLQDNREIDFMNFPDIRAKLQTMDITISLFCMDKAGIVYDPLHYIEDLRNRRIRIENADQKIRTEPWRIIRVLRFAATLGYEVEDLTKEACIKNVGLLDSGNENTLYTLKKLGNVETVIPQRVIEIAKDFGILDSINPLINRESKE